MSRGNKVQAFHNLSPSLAACFICRFGREKLKEQKWIPEQTGRGWGWEEVDFNLRIKAPPNWS